MLCTSVLAWMLLREGVPLPSIPHVSAIRLSDSGPLDLVQTFRARWPRSWHVRLHLVCILLTAVSLVLQFSSTLLLSDLATGPVQMFANTTRGIGLIGDDQNSVLNNYYTDPLLTTSPSYSVFAEYGFDKPASLPENVEDTGPTIRALLPLSTQDRRSQVLSFQGNATLYDARWICMPPSLSDLKLVGSEGSGGVLSGHVKRLPLAAFAGPTVVGIDFNCSLDDMDSDWTRVSWNVFACAITNTQKYSFGGVVSSLDTFYNASGYEYASPTIGHGHSWLILNVTNLDFTFSTQPSDTTYNLDNMFCSGTILSKTQIENIDIRALHGRHRFMDHV